MRVMIIGATGRTGRQVTEQALQKGHHVTAIVRSHSLPQNRNLQTVIADPCNAEQLQGALQGQDAVISCLGQRPGGNPWLIRDATEATLQAMEGAGVKRFLLVSGALLYPSFNPIVLAMKAIMAGKLADGRAAEALVQASRAEWTLVRPPRLLEADKKGYRIEAGERPRLTLNLSFADLAACLLDLAEGNAHTRQIVGVASH